jgi:very-short-patch-repair endonuclease
VSETRRERLKEMARAMRREPTEAEKALWARLSGQKVGGFKFHRQVVIGSTVVDFACPARWLVVEISGETTAELAALQDKKLADVGVRRAALRRGAGARGWRCGRRGRAGRAAEAVRTGAPNALRTRADGRAKRTRRSIPAMVTNEEVRMSIRLAPLVARFAPAPALAGVCESARFEAPEAIAGAVRPYVQCGIIVHDEIDTPVLLDGVGRQPAWLTNAGPVAACATIRAKAALEANQDLQATMPDRAARTRYIETVLQDADRFIAAAYTADVIGIDPAEPIAACDAGAAGSAE